MPKHTFRNDKGIPTDLLPEGEYIIEILKAEVGISNGRTTRGAEQLELTCCAVDTGHRIYETLIFHKSCDFRVDNFIKATGLTEELGAEIELNEENVIGLRAWVALTIDDYNNKKRNKVRAWLTNKPHVPRAVEEWEQATK